MTTREYWPRISALTSGFVLIKNFITVHFLSLLGLTSLDFGHSQKIYLAYYSKLTSLNVNLLSTSPSPTL